MISILRSNLRSYTSTNSSDTLPPIPINCNSTSAETKLCITLDSEEPMTIRVPMNPETFTLGQFKSIAGFLDNKFKFFFKTEDSEFGLVKEEVIDDFTILPVAGDEIAVWVITNGAQISNYQPIPRRQTESLPSYDDLPIPKFGSDCNNLDSVDKRKFSESHSLSRSITPRSLYSTNTASNLIVSNNSHPRVDPRATYEIQPILSQNLNKTLHISRNNIQEIFAALQDDAASLDIKDREWLKVKVKDAFLGSSLIKWLSQNVNGFCNKRAVKQYANQLLTLGFIKGPLACSKFSEKCYYSLKR